MKNCLPDQQQATAVEEDGILEVAVFFEELEVNGEADHKLQLRCPNAQFHHPGPLMPAILLPTPPLRIIFVK